MTSQALEVVQIKSFFDEATFTATHVVIDRATKRCAIIDSVLDYDPKSGRTETQSADEVIAYVKAEGLGVDLVLETHAHADHLTAAPYLKKNLGVLIAIGEHIIDVQAMFAKVLNAEPAFVPTARSSITSSGTAKNSGSAASRLGSCIRRDTRRPA